MVPVAPRRRRARSTPEQALEDTCSFWREWLEPCTYTGRWAEAVFRSLMMLKALTYGPTGGIVAAPTTSLPEQIGGVRNWDYRYCWLRDATSRSTRCSSAASVDEAQAPGGAWLLRAVAGDPDDLQIMYGPAGERRLTEFELPWLDGYEGSQPGPGRQRREHAVPARRLRRGARRALPGRRRGLAPDDRRGRSRASLLANLERRWHEPDEGIWEVRGPRRHFTHSKVMAWVAFDRGVTAVEEYGREGPVDRWREVRDEIHAEVLERGFDEELGSFVRYYDWKRLDASLLTIPLFGFLPADDPRVRGTLEAVRRELMQDGFVRSVPARRRATSRRRPAAGRGRVLPLHVLVHRQPRSCSASSTRRSRCSSGCCSLRNDLGLLSEEYDPKLERLVGNFPQAFSHIGLVNTALLLDKALWPRSGPRLSPAHRCPKWCAAGSDAPTSLLASLRASGPRLSSVSTMMLRFSLIRSKRPRTSSSGSPRTIARFRS